MTNFKLAIAATAVATVAACTSPVEDLSALNFTPMTGPQITVALVGNSLDGEDSDGEYIIHYDTDRTMAISYRGRTETGVWRVQGDRYCRRWQTFGNGKERCVTFYRNGNQINWVANGEITDRSVLVRGNPAGL